MTSHVLLPHGTAVNLTFKFIGPDYERLVSNPGGMAEDDVTVKPGIHTWNGDYTELEIAWRQWRLQVSSAVDDGDLYLLVTPLQQGDGQAQVIAHAGMLWGKSGSAITKPGWVEYVTPDSLIRLYAASEPVEHVSTPLLGPALVLPLDDPAGFCTGNLKTVTQITSVLDASRAQYESALEKYGDLGQVWSAVRSNAAWNTIYDAQNDRVITTPDRSQNAGFGGWSMAQESAFYAARIAMLDNPDLAIANLFEIMNEQAETGFVPAVIRANGYRTLDRSQLPVAGMVLQALLEKIPDTWLAEELFQDLLNWNRWWDIYRNFDGLLCPGSNPYQGEWQEPVQANARAAVMETGLGGSPLYSDIPYNDQTQMLEVNDIALSSLYIADCYALADIAEKLGKKGEERELRGRGKQYAANLERCWDEDAGLYLNQRTDSNDKISIVSPILLYTMLTDAPSESQVQTMVDNVLSDPNKFGGEHVLPSLSRDATGFNPAQAAKGAIDPAINFWVYIGLAKQDQNEAGALLADKSAALLLQTWQNQGVMPSLFASDNGRGLQNRSVCSLEAALLGLTALLQAGH